MRSSKNITDCCEISPRASVAELVPTLSSKLSNSVSFVKGDFFLKIKRIKKRIISLDAIYLGSKITETCIF